MNDRSLKLRSEIRKQAQIDTCSLGDEKCTLESGKQPCIHVHYMFQKVFIFKLTPIHDGYDWKQGFWKRIKKQGRQNK